MGSGGREGTGNKEVVNMVEKKRKTARKKPEKRKKTARKITPRDRKVDGNNARKGSQKWHSQSPSVRKEERARATHGWGYKGKSPNTRPRKYKVKKKGNYF